jgi:inner membrane protein
MPTIITHAFTGVALWMAVYNRSYPKGFWILTILLPVIPDADVICFKLGIPYSSFWGHRGFFHSIFFSCLLGTLTGFLLAWAGSRTWKQGLFYATYFSFVTALHGILDAFTNGGLGIALLSPFTVKRYFFPVTPIKVSPIGIINFFNERGIEIIVNEILWVWIPCSCIALVIRIICALFLKKESKYFHRRVGFFSCHSFGDGGLYAILITKGILKPPLPFVGGAGGGGNPDE